jgi:hypothetical protein
LGKALAIQTQPIEMLRLFYCRFEDNNFKSWEQIEASKYFKLVKPAVNFILMKVTGYVDLYEFVD